MAPSRRVRLLQTSESTLRQLCDDASDPVLIENNGITRKWIATQFLTDSIVFRETSIGNRRVVAALTLTFCVNRPLYLGKHQMLFQTCMSNCDLRLKRRRSKGREIINIRTFQINIQMVSRWIPCRVTFTMATKNMDESRVD